MATQPDITVAVTCFNAEDTIERSLLSVLALQQQGLEILVVDDCSQDNSVAVVEKMIAEGHPVRLVKHAENTGVAQARNTLWQEAKGEFIAYLDDDDECLPDRLAIQKTRLLEAEQEFGTQDILCFGNRRCIDQNGAEIEIDCMGSSEGIPHGDMVADFILYRHQREGYSFGRAGTCALFCRVATLKKFDGFDPAFRRCAELDLETRMGMQGAYFVGVDEDVIVQYITDGEANEKNYAAERKYYMLLLEKHRAYLEEKGIYRYARYRVLKMVAYNNRRRGDYYKYLLLCCLVRPAFIFERLAGKQV